MDADAHGVEIPVVAHAGDGNTHPLIVFDPADADMARLQGPLAEDAQDVGVVVGAAHEHLLLGEDERDIALLVDGRLELDRLQGGDDLVAQRRLGLGLGTLGAGGLVRQRGRAAGRFRRG